jgi:hypothetical protein
MTVLGDEPINVRAEVKNAGVYFDVRDPPLLTKLGDELRRESDDSGELLLGKSEFCCGIIKRHASTFPLCLTPFASVGRIFNETTWLSYFSSNAVWLKAWRVVNVWRLTPRAFSMFWGRILSRYTSLPLHTYRNIWCHQASNVY